MTTTTAVDDVPAVVSRRLATLLDAHLQWGSPPGRPLPVERLQRRDLDILALLTHVRYVTTSMIAALVWGSYSSRLRDRLKTLHDAHLLRRFRPAVAIGVGNLEWVYTLTSAGHDMLTRHRPDQWLPWQPSRLHSFAYAEHDLELAEMLVHLAARAAAPHGPPYLAAIPFEIAGPAAAAVDLRGRQPLDAHPANERHMSGIVHAGRAVPGRLEPDLTLTGRLADTYESYSLLIEYDRTRRPSKLASKLNHYDWFLADGWRRTSYARHPHEPGVLFVVRDEQRLAGVLAEAHQQLTVSVGGVGHAPTRWPGREEIAFTTRSRLIGGDPTIDQVRSEPRGEWRAADARRRTPVIQGELPIELLFASKLGA